MVVCWTCCFESLVPSCQHQRNAQRIDIKLPELKTYSYYNTSVILRTAELVIHVPSVRKHVSFVDAWISSHFQLITP